MHMPCLVYHGNEALQRLALLLRSHSCHGGRRLLPKDAHAGLQFLHLCLPRLHRPRVTMPQCHSVTLSVS